MPDNITFSSIPSDIRTGGVFLEIDPSNAVKGPAQMPRKMLLIGQRLSSGGTPALTPVRLTSADQAAVAFGQGSMLHLMAQPCDAVRLLYGQQLDLVAIALDDSTAGTVAQGTISLTGTITQAGTLNAYIGGVRVSCVASYGDTAAVLGTKLAAVISANPNIPVSAVADNNGVVTVKANHKGAVSNGIELAMTYYDDDTTPAGITAICSDLAGGSGDPDVGAALAVISDDWFYSIASAYTDSANLAAVEAEMDNRWGGTNMRTGHIFNAKKASMAQLTTWGDTRNSPHCSTWGIKGSPTWDPVRAAAIAATCEISGSNDPAMPLRNLVVPGVLAPRSKDRFRRDEDEILLHHGISTTTVDASGNVVLERVVTNYQKNIQGAADTSLLRLETKWTADYFRYSARQRIQLRFPRHKLADDGTNFAPGQKIVTPARIRSELVALHAELEEVGIVEDTASFKKNLIVQRSSADVDRVNAILPPNLVNQFVTFAAAVQYVL